jgi:FkbM family methyltransferase
LFREEGIRALISGGKRKIFRYFDPIYQQIKPKYKSYSVGFASAEFDMSRRQLGRYDFVDDLRSEQALIKRILSVVEDDDVFYDIGANIGIYTCLIASQLDSGTVIAFEPTPDTFDILERNVKRNDVKAELFNVALSNENGTTHMQVHGQTGHQFSEDIGTLEIETRRADDLIVENGLRPPDVCKMDIEGAEYLALDGFRKTLYESDCDHLFCEIHTKKIESIGGSVDEIESLLRDLGFELEYLGDRRENYFVEATRHIN